MLDSYQNQCHNNVYIILAVMQVKEENPSSGLPTSDQVDTNRPAQDVYHDLFVCS